MRKPLEEKNLEAIQFIKNLNYADYEKGKHVVNEDFFFLIQEYVAKEADQARYETHNNYVDIQYIVEGEEGMEVAPKNTMEVSVPYNPEKDVEFYVSKEGNCKMVITAGGYAVFYPQDAHKPCIRVKEPVTIKKIVGKVRV